MVLLGVSRDRHCNGEHDFVHCRNLILVTLERYHLDLEYPVLLEMDFYCRCAVILDQLDAQKGSLKGLASKSGKANKARDDTRRLLAILIETLKCKLFSQLFVLLA